MPSKLDSNKINEAIQMHCIIIPFIQKVVSQNQEKKNVVNSDYFIGGIRVKTEKKNFGITSNAITEFDFQGMPSFKSNTSSES